MSSCSSSPTLTRTDNVVTNSLSTSTTTHVTTLPPSTTVLTLLPSCTATTGSCSAQPIITTSAIPGGTTTVVDTITVTVPITSSQVTTLWETSCQQTNQDTSVPSTPPPSSSPTPPPSSTSSQSFSTPPPSIIVTASSSTQADGIVTPVTFTITSTVAPVLVSQTATTSASSTPNPDTSKNLGPIIGGVVGGLVGLGAFLFLIWFLLRRRRRWDDIFENDDDVPAVAVAAVPKEKQADGRPKPYQYGLVGHTKSPSLVSAPSSPPPGSAPSLSDNGFDRSHHRNNSATPLLGPTTQSIGTSPFPRPPSTAMQDTNINFQGQPQDSGRSHTSPGAANAAATMMGRRDTDFRTGSPISFQEQRILQVTNADLRTQSPGTPTGATSPEPQRDGKGRTMIRGEKAPIVHLDGGRYQEGAAGSSSAAGPAPPAYFE
ncbi:hypothetical protein P691DRAFT_758945 [Macrolepiota fuliginosa MF-IS2]|uniref:Mid2 domain-containing protein n=1 Tax=Macrolepiota fuliginosa MF-IS2 TaxID=1400762 RepID=A0A9P5XEL9_9AGAR|nr:hypothetical protein P691DRAFT_758945 [Macrolepiota fuliginosa MF-IS2]